MSSSEHCPVIECINLSKTFDEGPREVEVLKGFDFKVEVGERVAIVGKSGSGKTTLLNMLGGLDQPSKGFVKVAGQDFSTLNATQRGRLRNQYIGFVYQFHHLLAEFTALENVAMPFLIRGETKAVAAQAAKEILDRVGLSHREDHKPGELSGGERQRVALARALVTRPACVLADEPTGNLDSHTADSIQQLMLSLNHELAISFIVVTHDLKMASDATRIFEMEDGLLSETSSEGPLGGQE